MTGWLTVRTWPNFVAAWKVPVVRDPAPGGPGGQGGGGGVRHHAQVTGSDPHNVSTIIHLGSRGNHNLFRRIFLTLRLGIYSLLLHKLRSGLAVLGILIGIMAVIWLVAMGEGVSYQAQQQIKDLGANNIIVRSVKPSQTSSKLGNTTVHSLRRAA